MPRKPTKPAKSTKPKATEKTQECDCPFCPLLEYGKNIDMGHVKVMMSEINKEANTFTANVMMDDDMPSHLSDSFNTLMLYARNNKKLKNKHILYVYMGASAITITRYDTDTECYSITLATTPIMNQLKTEIVCVEVPL